MISSSSKSSGSSKSCVSDSGAVVSNSSWDRILSRSKSGLSAASDATDGISAAIWWGDQDAGRAYMRALATRKGPITPLITARPDLAHVAHERHLCVDTTAAGGNAALLAG